MKTKTAKFSFKKQRYEFLAIQSVKVTPGYVDRDVLRVLTFARGSISAEMGPVTYIAPVSAYQAKICMDDFTDC